MRERESAKVSAEKKGGGISVSLTHSLDKKMYYLPLTLKTYIPSGWTKVTVTQGSARQKPEIQHDEKGAYVLYQVTPNSANATLHP